MPALRTGRPESRYSLCRGRHAARQIYAPAVGRSKFRSASNDRSAPIRRRSWEDAVTNRNAGQSAFRREVEGDYDLGAASAAGAAGGAAFLAIFFFIGFFMVSDLAGAG
jgi:hypothetical protein